jgi:hypothetical protein
VAVNIETIGVAFETAPLKDGIDALNKVEQAANKAADGADKLGEKAKKSGEGLSAMDRAARASRDSLESAHRQAQAFITNLERQTALYGKSRTEALRYDSAMMGMTKSQRQYVDQLIRTAEEQEKAANKTNIAATLLVRAGGLIAGAFSAWKIAEFIKDSALLAARFETMGVVMGVAGNNAGYTRAEMDLLAKQLQTTGISMMESRNALTQLATANIDLSKATSLARAAQDLAVVGNINSSEALQRMIHGIKSGEVEILRTLGLNVSFEASYKKLAEQLNKNTTSLTEHEKMQARVNAVLTESTRYNGIYEESMSTAGKAMTSLTRYWEDFKVKAGDTFLPALAEGVWRLTDALKGANAELERAGADGTISKIGTGLANAFKFVAEWVARVGGGLMYVIDVTGQYLALMGRTAEIIASGGTYPELKELWSGAKRDIEATTASATKFQERMMGVGETTKKVATMTEEQRIAAAKSARDGAKADDAAAAAKKAALEYTKQFGTEQQKANIAVEEWKNKMGAAWTPEMESRIRSSITKTSQTVNAALAASAEELKQQQKLVEQQTKAHVDRLTSEHKRGIISEEQFITGVAEAEMRALESAVAVTAKELALIGQRKDAKKELVALEGQLQLAREKVLEREKKMLQDIAELHRKQEQAERDRMADLWENADKQNERLREQVKTLEEETAALCLTKVEVAELAARRLEDAAATAEQTAQAWANIDPTGRMTEVYRDQAKALHALADAKRKNAAREVVVDTLKEQKEEWKKTVENIDKTFMDGWRAMLTNGKEGWSSWAKSLKNSFKALVADEIYKMFVRPIVLNFVSSFGGGNLLSGIGDLFSGNGNILDSLFGGSGNAISNVLTKGFGNIFDSIGSQVMTWGRNLFGNTGIGASLFGTGGGGSAVATSAGALEAGTLVEGVGGTPGLLGNLSALAPFAAILAPLFAAFADGFFNGEDRSYAEVKYSAGDGIKLGATNSVDAQSTAATETIVANAVAGLNRTFEVLGLGTTVSGAQGQWESSEKGRGGVYFGGTLSNGVTFGESGLGSNYDANSPIGSKYEWWTGGVLSDEKKAQLEAQTKNPFLKLAQAPELLSSMARSGTPEEVFKRFTLDVKQGTLEALQVMAGMRFNIERRDWQEDGLVQTGNGEDAAWVNGTIDRTEWVRVIDEAALAMADASKTLPSKIWDLIRGKDFESMGEAEVDAILGKINIMVANVSGFRMAIDALPVEKLKNLSFDAAAGLVELSGGLENFVKNLTSYVDNFYSATEKRSFVVSQISKTLAAGGINIDQNVLANMTRDQFRTLVESIDVTTEAGQRMYTTMLSVAGSFASITQAGEDSTQELTNTISNLEATIERLKSFSIGIKNFRDSLLLGNLSPLTPGEKYAEAKRQFDATYTAAMGGDADAQARLQGVAQEFLQASQTYNASSAAYLADFARVQSSLTMMATKADSQVSIAQSQLAAAQSQLAALQTVNQSVQLSGEAIAAAIQALAASLGAASSNNQLPTTPAQQSTVTQLYQELFNRTPEAEGLNYWSNRLAQGESVDSVRRAMLQSAEYIAREKAGLASGGLGMGWSTVGETGTEVVDFATPGRVYTAQETRGMFAPPDAIIAELREIVGALRGMSAQQIEATRAMIQAAFDSQERAAKITAEEAEKREARRKLDTRMAKEATL